MIPQTQKESFWLVKPESHKYDPQGQSSRPNPTQTKWIEQDFFGGFGSGCGGGKQEVRTVSQWKRQTIHAHYASQHINFLLSIMIKIYIPNFHVFRDQE